MKVSLISVGRLARGPEAELCADYLSRAALAGRHLGFTPVQAVEVEARRRGSEGEGEALLAALPGEAFIVSCDERGEGLASRAFARALEELKDRGERHLAIVIGGADGLSPAVRARSRRLIAFGPQTWPHALARVMLFEQVYRAFSILSGAPYHRD